MKICVFCGSKSGEAPEFTEAAKLLGRWIGESCHELVYGGAKVGLMGSVADSALNYGARVTGILPEALRSYEVEHPGLDEFHWVKDMHVRKALMESFSDVFVALPGGVGTFEEFFEQLTWRQIGIHTKPVVLFNVAGYYDTLIDFMREVEAKGFLREPDVDELKVIENIEELNQFVLGLSQKV